MLFCWCSTHSFSQSSSMKHIFYIHTSKWSFKKFKQWIHISYISLPSRKWSNCSAKKVSRISDMEQWSPPFLQCTQRTRFPGHLSGNSSYTNRNVSVKTLILHLKFEGRIQSTSWLFFHCTFQGLNYLCYNLPYLGLWLVDLILQLEFLPSSNFSFYHVLSIVQIFRITAVVFTIIKQDSATLNSELWMWRQWNMSNLIFYTFCFRI